MQQISSVSPRRRNARRVLAVLAGASLVAAACGSDDSSSSSTEAPAATDAPAATEAPAATDAPAGTEAPDRTEAPAADKDPVTVAALFDQTGPSPSAGGGEAVVQAVIDAINDEGGLNGHPIELKSYDTKGDAAAALAAVEQSASDNPVAYLLSSPSTETATGDALAATGVPIIGVGYQPSVWGGSFGDINCASAPDAFCAKPNFLTITTNFSAVVAEQVIGAQAAGATVLATAACAEVDSCSQAAPVFDATAAELGLTSLGVTKVSSSAADYSAECIGWIQDGAEFIQISGSSAMGVNLMASCDDQGYTGIWGASAGTVGGDLLTQPYALAGGINAFPWWVDDAPVAEYRDIMDAAGVTESEYAGPTQTGLYSALRLLQKAVNDHADPEAPLDAAAALAAFYQVEDETLDGLIAPVTFAADNLDRVRGCFWPYIKDPDGTLTNPLGGLTYQCYPAE